MHFVVSAGRRTAPTEGSECVTDAPSCDGDVQAADQAMRAANQKAADAAFQANNRSGVRGSDTIDLHGLYVEEAVSRLKRRLDEAHTEVQCFTCCVPLPPFLGIDRHFGVALSVLKFCNRPAHTMLS